jgi:hypothetical protein
VNANDSVPMELASAESKEPKVLVEATVEQPAEHLNVSGRAAGTATPISRIWAMRTSRDSEAHRRFIAAELHEGRLRQGWGYSPDQDLIAVKTRINDPQVGYNHLTDDEKWAWGHWRLLGETSNRPDDAICEGDIILVPNFPNDGLFILCKVTGPYQYDIAGGMGDFGHVRPVEVLTPGGVAFEHELVSAELRRSLRCRSRLWWIGDHAASINAILAAFRTNGAAQQFRKGTDHLVRAQRSIADTIEKSVADLATSISAPLHATLKSAEWEPVLKAALVPLMRDVDVIHTGGSGEKGADIEIHIPNPFAPERPWVVAVQLKDYTGEIPAYVADQIEEAITARIDGKRGRQTLVSVILASTAAKPSAALLDRLAALQEKYQVSVECVHGHDLMRVFARGMFIRHRELRL